MTRTEDDLRALLERRAAGPPGNADRVVQVHGRIRRTRRRRQAAAGVLALAVAGVAVGLTVPGHGSTASVVPAAPSPSAPGPSPAPTTSAPAPIPAYYPALTAPVGTVPVGRYGVAALAGYGPVLLDATGGHTAAVAPTEQGQTALDLSYDSRFLAAGIGQDNAAIQVTDISGHVLLTEVTSTWAVAWSPTTDVLAVATDPNLQGPVTVTFYRFTSTGHTKLAAQTIAGAAGQDQNLVWSPDGSRLAVGNDHAVTLLTAAGKVIGEKTFRVGEYPQPATWSGDGSHLVVFVHTSASLDADGVQVIDLDATGHQVATLPTSLAYQQWWHPLPGSAVLGTLGGDRDVAHGKTVARCDLATAHCTSVAGDSATSAFDAVPTATGIAYITAANSGTVGSFTPSHLEIAAADGASTQPAPSAPKKVTQVLASADGRTLLLVGAGTSGPPGIYRYDGTNAIHLTDVSTQAENGYYGQSAEIVSWRQPNGH